MMRRKRQRPLCAESYHVHDWLGGSSRRLFHRTRECQKACSGRIEDCLLSNATV